MRSDLRTFDDAGRYGNTMAGMGQAEGDVESATSTDWGQTLLELARGYAEYDLQKEALDVNLARAQQGLPPLDLSTYGAGVQIGMAPSTQNTLLIIGAVIAGALILPKLLK